MNDYKNGIEGLQQLLKIRKGDPEITKELVNMLNHIGEPKKAIAVVQECLDKMPKDAPNLNLVNMLVELHMGLGDFSAGYTFVDGLINRLGQTKIPLDILVNYAICLSYSGNIPQADPIFEALLQQPVQQYNDLFFSVAETFMALNVPERAVPILELLLNNYSSEYDRPVVWMKMAQCYKSMNHLQSAITYLERVMSKEPTNLDATLMLGNIYKENDQPEKGIMAYDAHIRGIDSTKAFNTDIQDPDTPSEVDPRVWVEKGFLHYSLNEMIPFLESVLPTIDQSLQMAQNHYTSRKKHSKRNYAVLLNASRKASRLNANNNNNSILPPVVREDQSGNLFFFGRRGQKPPDDAMEEFMEEDDNININVEKPVNPVHLVVIIGQDRYYDLLYKACQVLANMEYYELASSLISESFHFLEFIDRAKAYQLRLLDVGIGINSGRYLASFNSVRIICSKKPNSPLVWNLFVKLVTVAGSFISHSKFIERLVVRHPTSVPLIMLEAHHRLLAESYFGALKNYFKAYRITPNEPIISLCIGSAYLGLAMSRKMTNRHDIVLRAFTFLHKYHQLLDGNEEACYNLGRAFHQIGLTYLAIPHYEKVLQMNDEKGEGNANNLSKEAAWNLVLIYRNSNSLDMAREVMSKYLVV